MAKKPKPIGQIGNYYGGLLVKEDGEKRYWGIENYNGTSWEEITLELYEALLKFNKRRFKSQLIKG